MVFTPRGEKRSLNPAPISPQYHLINNSQAAAIWADRDALAAGQDVTGFVWGNLAANLGGTLSDVACRTSWQAAGFLFYE